MARMAYAMAMDNPNVTADVIEVQEFPNVARMYMVSGVPKTVINNVVEVLGAVPEPVLVQRLLTAIGQEDLMAEFKEPPTGEPSSGPTTMVGR